MRRAASGRESRVRSGPCRLVFGVGWRAALATGTLAAGLAGCARPSDPQGPGGGVPLQLDYAYFSVRIEPVLKSRDCTRTDGCHGGQGAGQMLLSDGSNPPADFLAVRPLTRPADPPASPLLLKPLALAQGGVVHGGGEIFADTTDADYRTLRRWIAGEKLP